MPLAEPLRQKGGATEKRYIYILYRYIYIYTLWQVNRDMQINVRFATMWHVESTTHLRSRACTHKETAFDADVVLWLCMAFLGRTFSVKPWTDQPQQRKMVTACTAPTTRFTPTLLQADWGSLPHSEHRFPAPSSKLCQIYWRHWRGTLYLRVAVHRRGQRPPKGSGTNMTVETA